MNCPGSVALLKKLQLTETTDEPEYRGLGIAAHELAAECLRIGQDTWELIGEKFHGFEVDKEMADAVQVYLDAVRPAKQREGAKSYVEYRISSTAHEYFYGTVDDATVWDIYAEITDYKHGEGILVEVKENPQVMYYAFGILLLHPNVRHVKLRIVQPRISYAPAVREWEVDADYIRSWANDILLPAMRLAELEAGDLDAGEWCRFCPAKLICPMMVSLFGAACTADPQKIVELTDESLGRGYPYLQALTFYKKAYEEEIYNRLNRGGAVPGCKLVPKKANRVFRPEAIPLAKEKFGEDAFTKPEMKSPAEIDKLGKNGKEFTHEYAFTPQTGLTVASEDDNRVGVKVQSSKEAFGKALEGLHV